MNATNADDEPSTVLLREAQAPSVFDYASDTPSASLMARFLDWIVANTPDRGPEYNRRAKLFGVICVILICVTPIRSLSFFLSGEPGLAVGYAVLFFANIGLLTTLQRGVDLWWPTQVFAALIFFVVCVVSVQRGGIGASILSVHGVLIVAVTYVVGGRTGAFWALMAVLFGMGLAIFEHGLGIPLEDQMADAAVPLDTGVVVIVCLALMFLTTGYESSRHQMIEQVRLAELERSQAEARVVVERTERMASVGMLAAGVGHEVNNPLTFVKANLEFALEELHAAALDRELLVDVLTECLDGAGRIAKITDDLRVYSRVDASEPPKPTTLHTIVESAVNLAKRELTHRAALSVFLEETPPVMAVESRVVQVLINLLINAAHAVEGRSDAAITVRSGSSREYAWLEVADNGTGISPANLRKIFQPFFTTKETGVGTGLGLSVSSRIIESFGGMLTVTSREGEGATFRVSLPVTHGQGQSLPARPSHLAPVPESRRILIVEDDQKVGVSLVRMLKGHDVRWCPSGEEALKLLEGGADFDLVLCDVMMHPMPGWEVHEAMGTRHPHLVPRFVFMTGGAFTESSRAHLTELGAPVLHKPISRQDIAGALRRQAGQSYGAAQSA